MGIVRLLLFAALIWLLYRLIKTLKPEPRIRDASRRSNRRLEGGELVQDPQCGVYIPKETAVTDANGRHFCSEACRDAFRSRSA